MSEWLLALGVAVGALSLTYFFCLRPMWQGSAGNEPAQARAESAELNAAGVEAVPEGTSSSAAETTGRSRP